MKGTNMLRTLLAVILALAVSTAGAQIVNRPVAAGSISNPGTSLPATCAVGYVYFKSNSTAGQNLHLCTAANTWTQMTGGNLANPVTPAQGGSGVANSKNLTWSASLTFAGTDATTMTFPTTTATIARTDAGQTFTGTQAFGATTMSSVNVTGAITTSAGQITAGVAGTSGFQIINNGVFGTMDAQDLIARRNSAEVARFSTSGMLVTASAANQLRMAQTTPPTCSSNCGTSPSVSGTDTAGIVTMGGSGVPASGWVLTFNGTWTAAPACVVQMYLAGMVVGKMPLTVATSTTTITVVTNGTAPSTSDKYVYHCIGVS